MSERSVFGFLLLLFTAKLWHNEILWPTQMRRWRVGWLEDLKMNTQVDDQVNGLCIFCLVSLGS
jgi:hypothetical protein